MAANPSIQLGTDGNWAIKEDNLLAYKKDGNRFFNKEFDFTRGSFATFVDKDGLIKISGLQETNLVNNGDFSEIGPDLVTNGDFATDSNWTKAAGATVSNGRGNIIGDGTSFTHLSQSNVFTVGKFYKVTLDAVINSGLGLKVQDGSTNENFGGITTSGTYTFYGKANNANLVIGRRTGGTAFDSYIDNISVKEVGQNWSFTDGATITDNGVRILSDGTYQRASQDNVLTVGKQYKIQYEIVENNGGNLKLQTSLGIIPIPTTVGIHTVYGEALQTFLTIERNGACDITITNISVKEIQTDVPRIDFTDDATGHLLLEPQSTNLITYSEFNSESPTNWQTGFGTGTFSYDLVSYKSRPALKQRQQTEGRSYKAQNVTVSTSTTYTLSFYIDKENSINIDDSDIVCAIISSDDIGFTSRNYGDADENNRINFTFTTNVDTSIQIRIGLGASGNQSGDKTLIFSMPQLEARSYTTSYIPTYGTSVTRSGDQCNVNDVSGEIGQTQGTIFLDADLYKKSDTEFYIAISDGSLSNSIYLHQQSQRLLVNKRISGATELLQVTSGNWSSGNNKCAITYTSNEMKIFVNGVLKDTETINGLPSGLSKLTLGSRQDVLGSLASNSNYNQAVIFPTALTDSELYLLTVPQYQSYQEMATALNYTL